MPGTRTRRDQPGYQRKRRELSEEQQEELRRFVEKINHLQPSEYQEAIFAAAKTGRGKYVVNAGPGSGKTTTAIKLSTFFMSRRAIYFSFNKKIQVDTSRKLEALGSRMVASTLHSFGKAAIEEYLGTKSQVDDHKYERLIEAFLARRFPTFLSGLRNVKDKEIAEMQFDAKDWSKDLVHYVQVTLSAATAADMLALIDQFSLGEINPDSKVWPLVVQCVPTVLEEGKAVFRDTGLISFDDMVCYPASMPEISVPKYDHIIIDEAQDLNKAQLRLVTRACQERTQVFAIGDEKQSIYAFTGADHDSIPNIIRAFQAELLPLRVCYRCGTAIIDLANQLNGAIIPAPGAHTGLVEVLDPDDYLDMLRRKDAVVSRVTARLVSDCLKVLQRGQRAMVLGKQLGQSIASIVTRLEEMRVVKRGRRLLRDDLSNLLDLLEIYHTNGSELIEDTRKKDKELALDELQDKVETVRAIYTAYIAKCIDPAERRADDPEVNFERTASDFKAYIEGLFTDDESGNMIQFMTAHRSKGLEFERVFVIGTELFPHPKAKSDKQQVQEENLMYVTITRAINELYFVEAPFACLRLPDDLEDRRESYVLGQHDLVVSDKREEGSEAPVVLASVDPVREVTLEEPAAPDYQGEQKPVKRGRGRPRKGGADAALRHGFEVTFDLRTIELLDAATDNRSEYLETLALERLAPQADEEQLAAKLEQRCKAFPALVAKKLQKIRATRGLQAAWDASEAVILFVDPQRSYYP
jgi:DNA helicase II / ATP-dependent DNA helicase PcrA